MRLLTLLRPDSIDRAGTQFYQRERCNCRPVHKLVYRQLDHHTVGQLSFGFGYTTGVRTHTYRAARAIVVRLLHGRKLDRSMAAARQS